MNCTRCYSQASVIVVGKFRNGRRAEDPRCEAHTPTRDEVGTTLSLLTPKGSYLMRDQPYRFTGFRLIDA